MKSKSSMKLWLTEVVKLKPAKKLRLTEELSYLKQDLIPLKETCSDLGEKPIAFLALVLFGPFYLTLFFLYLLTFSRICLS